MSDLNGLVFEIVKDPTTTSDVKLVLFDSVEEPDCVYMFYLNKDPVEGEQEVFKIQEVEGYITSGKYRPLFNIVDIGKEVFKYEE